MEKGLVGDAGANSPVLRRPPNLAEEVIDSARATLFRWPPPALQPSFALFTTYLYCNVLAMRSTPSLAVRPKFLSHFVLFLFVCLARYFRVFFTVLLHHLRLSCCTGFLLHRVPIFFSFFVILILKDLNDICIFAELFGDFVTS